VEHEDYLKDLARSLRWRRIDDTAVAEALREVSSEIAETGASPDDRFGDAASYAEQFERGQSMSKGYLIATVGALLATFIAGGYLVATMIVDSPPSLPRSLGVYGTCFIAMIVAVLAGYQYDRRLPRGLRT
jgi:hypothetical protein